MAQRRSRSPGTPLRVVASAPGARASMAGRLHVRSVDFHDPAARALREAMSAEMLLRYWERTQGRGVAPEIPGMALTAEQALWTGVAVDGVGLPVGHVALRRPLGVPDGVDGATAVEVKRMYVVPSHRGSGVATALLDAVEEVAPSLGARTVVLQTGERQPDAVRLYERSGYRAVPLFAPYQALPASHCFAKALPAVRSVHHD